MRKSLSVVTVLALLAAAAVPALCHAKDEKAESAKETVAAPDAKTSPIPPGAPATFADIAHELLPAVVNISSTLKVGTSEGEELPGLDGGGDDQGQMPEMPQLPPGSPFQEFFEEFMNKHGQGGGMGGEPAIPPASLGSGFVIDAEKGYVVTNNHVIKDADEVRVTFGDDSTLVAKIIGKDEKMDLAVLQVPVEGKKLTAVKFGDSDKMRVGDWVLAIGNPFGLGGTVTAGIISAQQRDINAGQYDDFIQTDASINRGNSGGPMFDLQGEVIGINTAIFSPSGGSVGIGFAIPSNMAKSVINQLIEYGKTRRGWIGVRIQSVTEEIAESLGIDGQHGALVASITPGGPAEKAKLEPGDVITEFDGKQVNAMRNLPRIVAETPIDKAVELKFWRDGKEKTAKIKVGELEKAEESGILDDKAAEEAKPSPSTGIELPKVGATVNSLSEITRKQYNVPDDIEGVVVSKLSPKGEAAAKGLDVGDVIVEINQDKVDTPKAAADAVEKAEKEGKTSILLLLNREGDVRFVALKLKK
jgi:serine protease Do